MSRIEDIEKHHEILVDVEQGWHKLVIQADAMLTHLDPDYKAIQIKQKFGDLRYYYTTKADELVSEMMQIIVDHFEEISGIVCERCGEAGLLRDVGGWNYTLCDTHWKEAKK